VGDETAVRDAAIWDFLRRHGAPHLFLRMPQVDFVEPILSAP